MLNRLSGGNVNASILVARLHGRGQVDVCHPDPRFLRVMPPTESRRLTEPGGKNGLFRLVAAALPALRQITGGGPKAAQGRE